MSRFICEKWEQSKPHRVVLGAILGNLTLGIPFYYGNLTSYSTSYFRFRLNGKQSAEMGNEWMLSTFLISLGVGIYIAGYAVDKVGSLKRTTMIMNPIFDISVGCTYFSVQKNVGLTVLTLMVIPGITSGVLLSISIMFAKSWITGKYSGAAMSVVSASFGLGAVIFNDIITKFLNPKNYSPDCLDGNMVYFSQEEILDTFPFVFILIGVVSLVMQFFAVLLTNDPPPRHSSGTDNIEMEMDVVCNLDQSVTKEIYDLNQMSTYSEKSLIKNIRADQELNDYRSLNIINKYQNGDSSLYKTDAEENTPTTNGHVPSNTQNSGDSNMEDVNSNLKGPSEKYRDLSTKEMLKTKDFYLLWFTSFTFIFGFLVVNNYYKKFGENWIEDDDFFSTIGTVSAITTTMIRILTGIGIDRFGVNSTLLTLSSIGSVLMGFWYLIVRTHKIVFLVWTISLSGIYSAMFSAIPVSVVVKFGHRNYFANYATLYTAVMGASAVTPPLMPVFLSLEELSWFWMFTTVSLMTGFMVVTLALF